MLGRQIPWNPSQPAIARTRALVAALVPVPDQRTLALEVVHRDVRHLEVERPTRLEAKADEVLDDLGLAVDHDRPPAGEVAERDPVALARELQLDAVVDEALALEALSGARLDQEVDDALLEHARAHAFDVLAAPVFEDHRVDALEVQEVAEREPRRAGADDAHLRRAVLTPVRFPPRARVARSRTRRWPRTPQ